MEPHDCPGCGALYRPRSPAESERCWSCAGLGYEYLMTTRPGGGPARVEVTHGPPRKPSVERKRTDHGALIDALAGLT